MHAEAAELFALEPAAFVAARDALARRLKAAGEVAAADEVRRLRRPTAAAAALNRVARDEPSLVDDLLAAGAALADAQTAAVGGDRDVLRDASRARRVAVQRATSRAVALAGAAHREAIAATLEAAALDPEVAELLAAGTLTKDAPPPSAFGFAGVPDDLPERPPVDEVAAARRRDAAAEVEKAERALEASRSRFASAEQAVAAARRALDDAQATLRSLD